MQPKSRPTLKDVARVAGVSMPTVSRVLNGTVPVKQAKVEAVNAAIKELKYRPNAAARNLAVGEHTLVGVLAHDITRYGYTQTIEGIRQAAHEIGYSVATVVVESGEKRDVDKALELILAQPLAGILAIIYDPFSLEALSHLMDVTHVVAVGGHLTPTQTVPNIQIDDESAAYDAVNYLLDNGHQTVHLMSLPPNFGVSGRIRGWRRALRDAGMQIPEIISCDYDFVSGFLHGAEVVERARRGELSAVLCGNDELAVGLMAKVHDEGLKVPDDIAIIGFDGQQLGEFVRPALTTVNQDFVDLGRKSFDLLREYMAGDEVGETIMLPAEFIKRESA